MNPETASKRCTGKSGAIFDSGRSRTKKGTQDVTKGKVGKLPGEYFCSPHELGGTFPQEWAETVITGVARSILHSVAYAVPEGSFLRVLLISLYRYFHCF